MLFEPYVRFHIFSSVRVTEWHLMGNSCSLSLRYDFLVYVPKCQLSFSHPLVYGVGISLLIAPFPDHCLIVPLPIMIIHSNMSGMSQCTYNNAKFGQFLTWYICSKLGYEASSGWMFLFKGLYFSFYYISQYLRTMIFICVDRKCPYYVML